MSDHSTALLGTSSTSLSRPAGNRRLIGLSLLAGLALAVLWSAQLVDDDVGVKTANGLLGHNARTGAIAGTFAGAIFAFVAGFAGTFTACNVAVFGALAPLSGGTVSAAGKVGAALRSLAWLAVGACAVAGVYGAVGVALGTKLPQLSNAMVGGHVAVRIVQSIAVFSLIGLVMLYLGFAAAGVVPDPLGRIARRRPHVREVVFGVMIGGFLIGRPWPMFFKLFTYAASTHNEWFGALSLILVALGNILLMGLLFLALAFSRFPAWLNAKPGRPARFSTAAFLAGGAFTLIYWGVRVPAHFGYGWFPSMPWH
jgi:uncharacterized membrane protein (DUF441 family)